MRPRLRAVLHGILEIYINILQLIIYVDSVLFCITRTPKYVFFTFFGSATKLYHTKHTAVTCAVFFHIHLHMIQIGSVKRYYLKWMQMLWDTMSRFLLQFCRAIVQGGRSSELLCFTSSTVFVTVVLKVGKLAVYLLHFSLKLWYLL